MVVDAHQDQIVDLHVPPGRPRGGNVTLLLDYRRRSIPCSKGLASVASVEPSIVRRPPFGANPSVGERGSDTRRRVLESALAVFGEVAYPEARVELITERAGCSRPAFYQCFVQGRRVLDPRHRARRGHGGAGRPAPAGHARRGGADPPDDVDRRVHGAPRGLGAGVPGVPRRHARRQGPGHPLGQHRRPHRQGPAGRVRPAPHRRQQAPRELAGGRAHPVQLLRRGRAGGHESPPAGARPGPPVPSGAGRAGGGRQLQAGALVGASAHPHRGAGGAGEHERPAGPGRADPPEAARRRRRDPAQAGYHDARVDDIVEAAGVSHGTFYRYFDSKDAFFRPSPKGRRPA
ncbi:MAG: TetR/AcrR family transcriptional regulator [Acidimicrobiales bacterium]